MGGFLFEYYLGAVPPNDGVAYTTPSLSDEAYPFPGYR
jgi:hypothetical protein